MKNKKCKIKRTVDDKFEFFRLFLYHVHGITYSKKTFDRRLKLLTQNQLDYYRNQLNILMDYLDYFCIEKSEDIDQIMSEQAENCCDKWNLFIKNKGYGCSSEKSE